jgi:hypothetical protein
MHHNPLIGLIFKNCDAARKSRYISVMTDVFPLAF